MYADMSPMHVEDVFLIADSKSLAFQTAVQRIVMECVNCEISLLKRNVKMNDYSKAGVEVIFPHYHQTCILTF